MRYKRPDKKNALSIIEVAKRDMDFTLSIKVTEESSPTIIRNIYERTTIISNFSSTPLL